MEFHWEERVIQQRNPNPAGNYMFKVNNRNSRTRCEICSKLTIKIPERRQLRRCGIFIVNFEHIIDSWVVGSHLQILLKYYADFNRINQILFPLKSSENLLQSQL